MLMPSDIRAAAAKRYVSQHKVWLKGEGAFPLRLSLGTLTEAQFLERRRPCGSGMTPGPTGARLVW